jgi:hypothetical protein
MTGFGVEDEVRIDIPDTTDPDFDRLHGESGEIVEVLEDDAGAETGDGRDSVIYRVALAGDGEVVDVRWRDLRPR